MTASLPLFRALAAPDRVRPVAVATGRALVADRAAPVPQGPRGALAAPGIAVSAALPGRPVSKTTVLLSSALHLLLVGGWAVFAAPARPLMPPDLDHAQVELVSQAAFAAMTAPQPAVTEAAAALAAPMNLTDTGDLATPVALAAPPMPTLLPPPAMATPDIAPAAPEENLALAEPLPPPKPKAAKAKPAAPEEPAGKTPAKAAEPLAQKPKEPAKPQKTAKAQSAAKVQGTPAPKPAVKAASKGEAKALKADWGAKVRARINRKVGAAKAAGTVKVRLSLSPSGALLAAGIAQSSGQAALDAAALKAVKSAAPYPRAPKGLSDPTYSFTLPITFKG